METATEQPTTGPTQRPSTAPSQAPTQRPSGAPTTGPSRAPTQPGDTFAPSPAPVPTFSPTGVSHRCQPCGVRMARHVLALAFSPLLTERVPRSMPASHPPPPDAHSTAHDVDAHGAANDIAHCDWRNVLAHRGPIGAGVPFQHDTCSLVRLAAGRGGSPGGQQRAAAPARLQLASGPHGVRTARHLYEVPHLGISPRSKQRLPAGTGPER